MRLLKAMMAMAAGIALAAGGASASAQAKQAPPAKRTTSEPAKQTTAPAKQAPTAPTKAGTSAPAPSGASAPASQVSLSPEMSPGNRRDPFAILVSRQRGTQRQAAEVVCRAPGKGSVVIDTMRLDGLVRSGDAMIAAVRTPQGRVYFLREGDRLCDGRVSRITMEGMTLIQSSRDAFGRGVDRPVNKRLFPSAGE